MYPPRNRLNQIILVVLILLSIVVITLHYKEGEEGFLHRTQGFATNLIFPLQSGVSRVVNSFRHGWGYIFELGRLREENQQLKGEVAELRGELISLREMERENRRLRKLVGFKEKLEYRTIPAHVIGKSPTEWQATIILDGGSADGIAKDMPVVIEEGLVGRVIEVASHAAQVQLVTDRKSGVAAQILRTGETGVIEGQIGGELGLQFISKDSSVRKGDIIITSGLGGVFPKGIPIGRVVEVKGRAHDLYKGIKVKSAVDFSKLEEVLIITDFPLTPPFASSEGR